MENKSSLPGTSTDNSYENTNILQEICIEHHLLQDENVVEISNDTQVINENEEHAYGSSACVATALNDVWNDKETKLLLTLYGEHIDDFQHAKLKKHVWMLISEKLSSKGIFKSADKCNRKWLNLIRDYRSVKDQKFKSGQQRKVFRYFNMLEELLASMPSNLNETFMVNVGRKKVRLLPKVEVIEKNADNTDTTNDSIPEKNKYRKNYVQEYFKTKRDYLVRKEVIKQKIHKEHIEMVAKRHEERMKIEAERNRLLKQILEKLS